MVLSGLNDEQARLSLTIVASNVHDSIGLGRGAACFVHGPADGQGPWG
jgi:hypothetical protein